jgi:hypothetical protein
LIDESSSFAEKAGEGSLEFASDFPRVPPPGFRNHILKSAAGNARAAGRGGLPLTRARSISVAAF